MQRDEMRRRQKSCAWHQRIPGPGVLMLQAIWESAVQHQQQDACLCMYNKVVMLKRHVLAPRTGCCQPFWAGVSTPVPVDRTKPCVHYFRL